VGRPRRTSFPNSPSQIVFEQLYLTGDRRLSNVTALGGATEAAFLKDRQEQAQFFDHEGKGDLKTASWQSLTGIIWNRLTNASVGRMNGTNTYEQLLDRLYWRYVTRQFRSNPKISAANGQQSIDHSERNFRCLFEGT
jgi:hypothetical protein